MASRAVAANRYGAVRRSGYTGGGGGEIGCVADIAVAGGGGAGPFRCNRSRVMAIGADALQSRVRADKSHAGMGKTYLSEC